MFIDCCWRLCWFSKEVVVDSPLTTMTPLALKIPISAMVYLLLTVS